MKKMTKRQCIMGMSLAVFGVLAIGLMVSLVSIGGTGFQISSLFGGGSDASTGKPADDVLGALEYEFNMTKDPATGKIPEGVFEAERAQAGDILRLQESLRIPEFASYNVVGPNNLGGRTRTVVYDVRYNGAANRTIFAGGVSGGVYKSVDDGASWVRKSPTGDHFSCTSIVQDPRPGFQDVWYYAVGESLGNSVGNNIEGAFYLGNGVYKSTNNGETWARLPASNPGALETFDNRADLITRIIVNPNNGDVYLAATAGIIRSTDGGATWTAVLPAGNSFGTATTTDIVVTSDGTFYAAFAGGNAAGFDGVWRSSTGASGSWTRIAGAGSATNPAEWNAQGAYGRVVLAVAPNLESRVYAIYYNNLTANCTNNAKPEAEFFYWNDLNSTWTAVSTDSAPTLPDEPGCISGNDPFADQGGYDLALAVKPNDFNTVFIGGTNAYRSTNAGTAWTRIGGYANPTSYATYPNSHADIHTFAFQPTDPKIMICGNDGGIQRTPDNLAPAVAWTPINNGYRTYQYFYVVNDPRSGNNKVIGGAQDNGTTRNIGGTGSQFEPIFSGDGVSVGLSDPAASGGVQYEYVGTQNGEISRRDASLGNGDGTDIKPTGAGAGLFVTLFKLDPDNTETLYYVSANSLYRTTAASTVTPGTWTQMTGIGTAVGAGANITAITMTRGAYNPATASLFIGTDNGRVFRLDNPTGAAAAAAPVEVSLNAGFPAGGYVSSIAVSPLNDDTAMVTFSNYGVTSVFQTSNANAARNNASPAAPTWTNIENNLTLPSFRTSAILNIGGTLEYFVGTSAGLYRITNPTTAGATWNQEGPGTIGNAVVASLDLRVADNKLLVGTHGIGMLSAAPAAPTAAAVSISGRVITPQTLGLTNALVTLTDSAGNSRTVKTGKSGGYRFENVEAGATYVLTVSSKRYTFAAQIITANENLTEVNFTAQ